VGDAARFLPCAAELRRGPLQAAQEALHRRGAGAPDERENYLQTQVNDLWRTLPKHRAHALEDDEGFERDAAFSAGAAGNLLYFIEKNAPKLAPWQREIVRIVRKIAQYFYPQRQTRS